jgi:hypothetical protein
MSNHEWGYLSLDRMIKKIREFHEYQAISLRRHRLGIRRTLGAKPYSCATMTFCEPAQAMIARAAAPRATREPIPTTGVARAAPAVSTVVLLGAGSPGRPEDEGTISVVVAVVEGRSVVGIGRPGGGRITLVVVATGGPLLKVDVEIADRAGGGVHEGLTDSGRHSVTVTVTVAAGAQTAGEGVRVYSSHVEVIHLLTVRGDDSQRKRSEGEDLVTEHVDSGNVIAGGDEAG